MAVIPSTTNAVNIVMYDSLFEGGNSFFDLMIGMLATHHCNLASVSRRMTGCWSVASTVEFSSKGSYDLRRMRMRRRSGEERREGEMG